MHVEACTTRVLDFHDGFLSWLISIAAMGRKRSASKILCLSRFHAGLAAGTSGRTVRRIADRRANLINGLAAPM
jgi:hypothetical protein